jgi:hypothetical protein
MIEQTRRAAYTTEVLQNQLLGCRTDYDDSVILCSTFLLNFTPYLDINNRSACSLKQICSCSQDRYFLFEGAL